MGFSITIQVDENYSMYLSNGYGDFSVGPLDKLARKYRHTGTYNEDSTYISKIMTAQLLVLIFISHSKWTHAITI